jgi:ssDNA-binding Zn-finger/Zn-ribbon topoisomerase 1
MQNELHSDTAGVKGQNGTSCPLCGSQAVYKYGRTNNRQRYICIMCNRQFIPGRQRRRPSTRPDCPACGGTTHLFKRKKDGYVVFRCCRYPECRTYVKAKAEEGEGA